MAALLVARWTYELPRLLFEQGPMGAMDLRMRQAAVYHWFAWEPVYAPNVVPMPYPPASYAILWPFLGWLDFAPARWLWAVTLLASLSWLTTIAIREGGARSTLERLFVGVFIPSTYAVCITAGNGQLGVHVLAALLGALLLLRKERSGTRDLLIGGLFAVSLVKPSIAAPFFWVLLLDRGGRRPAVLVVALYAGLTLLAAAFRPEGLTDLVRLWLLQSEGTALSARYGYANLHQWMDALGVGRWIPQGSLLVLVLLGAWILRHRGGPFWPLLGVTSIVARVWTYHALYDDVLLLIPLLALFRVARDGPGRQGRVAGFLLLLGWASALLPARLLTAPPPWDLAFRLGQTAVWMAVLVFLVARVTGPRVRPRDA